MATTKKEPGCYITFYKSSSPKTSLMKDTRNPVALKKVDYKSTGGLDLNIDQIVQPLLGPVKGKFSAYPTTEAEEAVIGTGDYFSLTFVGQDPKRSPAVTHYRILDGGYLMIRANAGFLPPNPLAEEKKAEEEKLRREAELASFSEN